MQYLTRYHMEWDKATGPTIDEVTQELHENVQPGNEDDMSDHSKGYWETVITGDVNTTWYEHQNDAAKIISRKWPEIRFRLHGQGDEETDIWNEYFLKGMVHRVELKMEYSYFDPEKLTGPKLPAE